MADWSEHAHYVNPGAPMGPPPAVTALAFDPYSELLWHGTSYGTVASLYSPQLQRYTSYAAHGVPTRPSPTKGILADERHIYSIGDHAIKCSQRRGLAKWTTLTHDFGTSAMSLVSMCASPLAASSDLIAAGVSQSAATGGDIDHDNDLIVAVNNSTGAMVRSVPSEAPIVHLRKSGRYICAGTNNGHVQLRDPRSLKVEHKIHAHPGGVIDIQADGNILYSVGWTVRQGHAVSEPLIKVHDLRTMRALVPIPFAAPGGPSLLAIHPKLSSTVIVSAPQGQFQIVDIATPGEGRFFYTNANSFTTSLSISPSADYIAFGEADGSVRLWSSSSDTSNLRFNTFTSSSLEFPDMVDPTPFVNWSTETPLSSIGMPHYNEKLLSFFDYDQYVSEASPLFNPPSKIDPAVLNNLNTVDYLGYASLPSHLRGKRNVVSGKGPNGVRASALHRPEDRKKIGIPLFRSEKEKEQSKKAAAAAAAGITPGEKKKKKAEKKRADGGSDSLSTSTDSRPDRRNAVDTASASSGTPAGSAMASKEDSPTDEASNRRDKGGIASDREEVSDDETDDSDASDEEEGQEDVETAEAMLAKGQMPSYYRLKTIQYSRFGVEDFDFDFYNKTQYSGLETHIQNSYANSYLQALHYLPPFRETAKAHILQNCPRENCLLCEAGFLFRMLEDAKGANCQASNFLRAFGNSHKAASLGLMDGEDSLAGGVGKNEVAYSQLAQTLNRFVLECTANEAQVAQASSSFSFTPDREGTAAPARSSPAGAPPGLGPPLSSNRGGASGGAGHRMPGDPATSMASMPSEFASSAAMSPVAKLFLLNTVAKTICTHCGRESNRDSPLLSVDLIYPRRAMSNEPTPPSDFASVLRASLVHEVQNRAPCRACQYTAMFRTRRVMPATAELPRVLSVNAAIRAPEHLHYWLDENRNTKAPPTGPARSHGAMQQHQQPFGKGPFMGMGASNNHNSSNRRGGGPPLPTGPRADSTASREAKRTYLPPRIAIGVYGDDVRVLPIYTISDIDRAKASLGGQPAIYKLRSMVVQISADKEQPHLCAIVRVPEADSSSQLGTDGVTTAATPKMAHAAAGGAAAGSAKKSAKAKASQLGPWYLFNDFLVRNVSESEALGFQNVWKMPSVLMWEREDLEPLSILELRQGRTSIDPTILCRDFNISLHRDPKRIRHKLLSEEELPGPGTLVAIDAEFVALNQEELEIRSDGTRSVIRPTRLSLARVSVVRGQGEKEGEAFIDDHIYTQEEVVDYLTKFSGILPGDLDPKTSCHTVVPLKAAYKKLRLLVDRGCIFIGHGLKKDFRIINIFVPPHQVIDTVDLYHSPNHPRRLSLRFLSWFLLKVDIQTGSTANNQITAKEQTRSQASTGGQAGKNAVETVAQSASGAGSTAVEGGHDSIEDALAALRLFRLYEVFKQSDRLEDVLEDIYDVGRKLNWKPPNTS